MTKPSGTSRYILLTSAAALAACTVSTGVAPAEPHTALTWESVLARVPMRDSAGVAVGGAELVVTGLLNQTAPCFRLTSRAGGTGSQVVVQVTASEVPTTCNTFAAGAFDYVVRVMDLAPGRYDVEVRHHVIFRDGRTTDAMVGSGTVVVSP